MHSFLIDPHSTIDKCVDSIMEAHPDYANLGEDEGYEWNAKIYFYLKKLVAARDEEWRKAMEKKYVSMSRKTGFRTPEEMTGWHDAISALNIFLQSPVQQKLRKNLSKT